MTDARTTAGRFSASDAALTGLRLLAREPATAAVWAALYLLFCLVGAGGLALAVGPAMQTLAAHQRTGTPLDPAANLALMSRILPVEGLFLLAFLAFFALLSAAVNRSVLRPGAGRIGRLGLGGNEGRQVLLFLILGVLFFLLYVVLVVVAAIFGALVGIAAGGGRVPAAAPGPMFAVFVLAGLAVLLVLAFVATRFSLAAPLTFDRGEVDAFGSWRLTRGVFWPLFGAYVLAWLIAALISLAAVVLFVAVVTVAGGGVSAAGAIFRPDMSSVGAYFSPVMLLWLLVSAVVGTVGLVMMLAAPAGAYVQLKALGRLPTSPPPGVTPAPSPPSDLPRFGR